MAQSARLSVGSLLTEIDNNVAVAHISGILCLFQRTPETRCAYDAEVLHGLLFVMRTSILSALLMLGLASAARAAGDTNYAKLEVVAGVQKQVRYHATGKKDCTAAAPPQVSIVDPPSHGYITVKQAILTTSRIPGCPNMKLPVRVVFYTGNPSALGRDHFVYQAKDINGRTEVFDYTVDIKPTAKVAPPVGDKGI